MCCGKKRARRKVRGPRSGMKKAKPDNMISTKEPQQKDGQHSQNQQ